MGGIQVPGDRSKSIVGDNLVIGASLKPYRYSNMAIKRLLSHGLSVRAIGLRKGDVSGVPIDLGHPDYSDIDTVLMYINPRRQPEYTEYIINLRPRRVIFNPGTENAELESLLAEKNIEVVEACSLVMLASDQY